MSIFCFEWNL